MNSSEYSTPQKLTYQSYSSSFKSCNNSNYDTPNSSSMCSSKRTTGSFHLLPFLHTPPSRLKKVINPFEHALTDRLHLPLICSPSLFKPPNTPKTNTTQFEWTIDEVSSLAPANVEPHETQFEMTSPDPAIEAKAQAAIRSYFKEQLIVPSPIECPIPIRNRKSHFSQESEHLSATSSSLAPLVKTEISLKKSSLKRSRNVITQTMLSFPPKLPTEVERILKKYLILKSDDENDVENCNNELQGEESVIVIDCNNMTMDNSCYDSKEVSRRLFDGSMREDSAGKNIKTPEKVVMLKCDDNVNTPNLKNTRPLTAKNSGSLHDDSSFGEISPISKSEAIDSDGILNSSSLSQEQQQKLMLHNITTATISSPKRKNDDIEEDELSTPSVVMNMSVDCSFIQQKQQKSTSSSQLNRSVCSKILKSKSFSDVNEKIFESDEMQVSFQLSGKSLCSIDSASTTSSSDSANELSFIQQQQHPETPIKKRYPSRKNLSHSFSYHLIDDHDDELDNNQKTKKEHENNENNYPVSAFIPLTKAKFSQNLIKEISKITKISSTISNSCVDHEKSSIFYRTDSGFNEITQCTQDESKFTADLKIRCGLDRIIDDSAEQSMSPTTGGGDISMIDVAGTNNSSPMRCCSTPSRRLNSFGVKNLI